MKICGGKGHHRASAHPIQLHGTCANAWSAVNYQAGRIHTGLSKDHTLLRSTITLIDALPVQERRHDRKLRTEDVGQS